MKMQATLLRVQSAMYHFSAVKRNYILLYVIIKIKVCSNILISMLVMAA